MSGLDLGPPLDRAAQILLQALQTAGTTVDLARPGAPGAVDPETAVAAAGSSTVLDTDVPALVVPEASSGEDRPYPGAQAAQYPRWRIIMPPTVTDLRRGDHVTVTASRDTRLVDAVFEVTVMLDNAAGAARTAVGHRLPVGGQT